jgi:hypothetical protein
MAMKLRVAAFFFLGMSSSAILSAQWPDYAPAGVPTLADGKPNLSAPAPKTAQGKPDFTGTWDFNRPRPPANAAPATGGGPPPAGAPAAPRPPGPPPPSVLPAGAPGLGIPPPGVNQFWNIGSSVEGGLPFQPWAKQLHDKRAAENSKDNPDAHCLPMGFMQFHTHPQPRKIVQTPGLLVIMYEANYGLRQIFLDGRPLPKLEEIDPWWYGYSVGHWEGDTLVVETIGLKGTGWLDVEGSPFTESAKITERMRRTDFGNTETVVTVDDPKAYTKPWSVTVRHKLAVGQELIEFICAENEGDAAHLVAN